MKRAKSVDDYINSSESWRSELKQLREILNAMSLTEKIKWGAPCYTCEGKNIVGVAAFNSYVGLWFYQGALLKDDRKVLVNAQEGVTKSLRQWRMQSAKEIKPTFIKRYVKEAIQLVKDGKSIVPAMKVSVIIPPELKGALKKNRAAERQFSELTPGRQRAYAEYISTPKRDETKQSRLKKIIPMIRSGMGLNDKYRC